MIFLLKMAAIIIHKKVVQGSYYFCSHSCL